MYKSMGPGRRCSLAVSLLSLSLIFVVPSPFAQWLPAMNVKMCVQTPRNKQRCTRFLRSLMYLSSRATLALQSPRLSTKNRVLSRTRVSEALIVNYSVVNVYVARKPSGSWEGLD